MKAVLLPLLLIAVIWQNTIFSLGLVVAAAFYLACRFLKAAAKAGAFD